MTTDLVERLRNDADQIIETTLHPITAVLEREAAAELKRLQARIEEIEIAVGQAVEFANYVEGAAKGSMVERARHFLSVPFAAEIAARLKAGAEAERLRSIASVAANMRLIDWLNSGGTIELHDLAQSYLQPHDAAMSAETSGPGSA